MKLPFFSKVIFLLPVFLAACQPAAETPTVLPATATLTLSPTPTSDPEIISPENASWLRLKWMNMGRMIGAPMYSPDGKWLYVESTAGTYAFDAASYRDIHLLESSPFITPTPDVPKMIDLEPVPGFETMPALEQAILSPDKSLIVRGFPTKAAHLFGVWRMADRKLLHTLEGYPKTISPDSRLITVERFESYETYTVYHIDLYDLQTGEQLGSWRSMRAFFLSDSRLVVEEDGYTRIFDPQTRKVPRAFPGGFAAFSPDEQNVAVLYGNRIHIYRVSDGKLLQNLDGGLPSTDEAVLRFSADGQILMGYTTEYYCCAGSSSHQFAWRVADGSLLTDRALQASPFATPSPDEQTFLMGSRVLRTSDESLVTDLETYFLGSITNLAFTPDGRQIIVATGYKHLYLYPVESTSLNSPQVADPKTYIPILAAAVSHPYPDDQIEVTSPDHRFMARRDKGLVTLFTWSGTGQLYTIPVYRVRRLTFSPDGQILALGLRDGTVVLWDVEKNRNIYNIPTRPSDRSYSVGGLAFSPDGKLLAIGLEDGTVRLFGIEAK